MLVGFSQTPRDSSSALLKAKDLPLLSRDSGRAVGLVLPITGMRGLAVTGSQHGCFGAAAPAWRGQPPGKLILLG